MALLTTKRPIRGLLVVELGWGHTGPGRARPTKPIAPRRHSSQAKAIEVSASTENRIRTAVKKYAAISLGQIPSGDLLLDSGHVEMVYRSSSGKMVAVSATHTGGPPVHFHSIGRNGLLKVGQVVT
jgi:hypothetical protein